MKNTRLWVGTMLDDTNKRPKTHACTCKQRRKDVKKKKSKKTTQDDTKQA